MIFKYVIDERNEEKSKKNIKVVNKKNMIENDKIKPLKLQISVCVIYLKRK
jgi:hypothetical protein